MQDFFRKQRLECHFDHYFSHYTALLSKNVIHFGYRTVLWAVRILHCSGSYNRTFRLTVHFALCVYVIWSSTKSNKQSNVDKQLSAHELLLFFCALFTNVLLNKFQSLRFFSLSRILSPGSVSITKSNIVGDPSIKNRAASYSALSRLLRIHEAF